MKKNKKRIISLLLILIGIIFLVFGFVLTIKNDNEIKNEEIKEETEAKDENNDDNLEENDEDIDDDIVEGEDDNLGYDGYYIKDNKLFRKEKEISQLSKSRFGIYKDKADKNSKYIGVVYKNNSYYLGSMLNDKFGVVDFSDYSSFLYDINTGENKKYSNYFVAVISKNKKRIIAIDPIGNENKNATWQNAKLFDEENWNIIDSKDEYEVVGDSNPQSFRNELHSNSDKYVVILGMGNNAKYGLIDYDGNIRIDMVYDDLVTTSDDILIAEKNGKFGVINASNKTILPFEYDEIASLDNYYAVIKNNKLGVYNEKGQEIVPTNINIVKINLYFGLRSYISSEEEKNLNLEKKNDDIIISYCVKKLDKEILMCDRNTLVIHKNGKYEIKK